jgi:N6-L-threonylcarbamoyladenine synthase
MDTYILGIESSCDETSVAIVKNKKDLLANIVTSQIKVHAKYGGVMPEIASRLHTEQISFVIQEALKQANVSIQDISAVAVVAGPGLIGALHVGLQAAKTIALLIDKPLIAVHHLAAHIYANQFQDDLAYPSMALVVSGGHTEIVYMEKELDFKILGSTQDDAIGEAYDKVARILGLGYPGGPVVDKLARQGQPTYPLPKPKAERPYDVSYSGLKTALINLVHKLNQKNETIRIEDMCASFQKRAIEMIIEPLLKALKVNPVKQVVLAGGVAANSHLRQTLLERVDKKIKVSLPALWCCSDNAAMVALLGATLYEKQQFANLSLGANPNWTLEEFSIIGGNK